MAPNRLLPGKGVSGLASLGPLVLVLAGTALGTLLVSFRPLRDPWALGVVAALVFVGAATLFWGTGAAAARLLVDRPPPARAMLGPGFWLTAAGLLLLHVEAARSIGLRSVALLALVTSVGALGAWLGLLDALSLAVEYRARADLVHASLAEHLGLAAAALGLALAFAVPLGWWSSRYRRVAAGTGAVLGAVQVVPAIALFGVLVPVLSLLLDGVPALREAGLRAIGPTPALIGVAAYLGLPLVRAVIGGLRAADPEVVEAARAMGLSDGRIAVEVRVPLGLPVFVAGLRVAVVQAIGLATLGGLIGAGGLGTLVFDGMAQFAPDLILLGALPVVLLALLADAGLRAAETYWVARSGP